MKDAFVCQRRHDVFNGNDPIRGLDRILLEVFSNLFQRFRHLVAMLDNAGSGPVKSFALWVNLPTIIHRDVAHRLRIKKERPIL